MDQELSAALETMAQRLRTEWRSDIQASTDQLRADLGADLRNEMRDGESRLGVLIEALRGDIQVVAEGVILLNGKFDRLAISEDRTRGRVDGLELRVLALEQAERERRRES